jgi:hypothetical protein
MICLWAHACSSLTRGTGPGFPLVSVYAAVNGGINSIPLQSLARKRDESRIPIRDCPAPVFTPSPVYSASPRQSQKTRRTFQKIKRTFPKDQENFSKRSRELFQKIKRIFPKDQENFIKRPGEFFKRYRVPGRLLVPLTGGTRPGF